MRGSLGKTIEKDVNCLDLTASESKVLAPSGEMLMDRDSKTRRFWNSEYSIRLRSEIRLVLPLKMQGHSSLSSGSRETYCSEIRPVNKRSIEQVSSAYMSDDVDVQGSNTSTFKFGHITSRMRCQAGKGFGSRNGIQGPIQSCSSLGKAMERGN